ncbi:hypothetical protein [Thermohalobacter berrensis]|uniref:hypothetical protein n=1 Tax=Thermohalobacter berrensis TaxID=99594 RepID=UPI0024313A12|nr:hypothetical protein [Thermohalobacter berrensis]
MQRCSMHIASATDIRESSMLGMKAIQLALEGNTGQMASLKRVKANDYKIEYTSVPIEKVANRERKIPKEWITRNYIKDELFNYLLPLIQGEVDINYYKGIPSQFIF